MSSQKTKHIRLSECRFVATGQWEGSEGQSEGSMGHLEGSGGQPEGSEGRPEDHEWEHAIPQTDGRVDGKSPHSTELCTGAAAQKHACRQTNG